MKRRCLLVLVTAFLMVGPVLAVQQLTERQRMEQAIALLEPLDSFFTGTARTNFRQAMTRLKNLLATLPADPVPVPDVDCAGTWSAWTPVGTCTSCVNGQQTCSEQRTFTATPGTPSGNGLACPISPEVRQVTQACTMPPPPSGAVLSSVSVNPSTVAGGGSVTIMATLTGPAPGARDVLLSVTPSGVLTVPAAIRVKEATTSGSVQATASNPQAQTVVTITATLGTDASTATLTVDPSSAPQQEICGNGKDDDGDGLIDEGCVVLPPASGNHSYFDSLLKLTTNLLRGYSLRDPAQLTFPNQGGFAHSNTRPLVVTYDPTNDPDPRRQDAAKVTIGTGSNSLTNQIHLPIPPYSGSLLVTWDAWFGREFAYAVHGIQNYKNFQLASGGGIWTEIRSRFSAATAGNISLVDLRYYGIPGPGFFVGNLDALSPMVGSFQVAPETWTRYWAFLNPTGGTYTELSLWVADPTHGPTQILDRALVTKRNGLPWDEFWLEYNTSNDVLKVGRPDLISYVRNVVMLKGISDPKPLLIKP